MNMKKVGLAVCACAARGVQRQVCKRSTEENKKQQKQKKAVLVYEG